MRLTLPDSVPLSIRSPTPTGRSTMRIRPETKLLTTFCSPKPMPTLSAPASSVTFAMSMPSAASVSAAPTMNMVQRVKVTIGIAGAGPQLQSGHDFAIENESGDAGQNDRRENDRERRRDRVGGDGHGAHLQRGVHQRFDRRDALSEGGRGCPA